MWNSGNSLVSIIHVFLFFDGWVNYHCRGQQPCQYHPCIPVDGWVNYRCRGQQSCQHHPCIPVCWCLSQLSLQRAQLLQGRAWSWTSSSTDLSTFGTLDDIADDKHNSMLLVLSCSTKQLAWYKHKRKRNITCGQVCPSEATNQIFVFHIFIECHLGKRMIWYRNQKQPTHTLLTMLQKNGSFEKSGVQEYSPDSADTTQNCNSKQVCVDQVPQNSDRPIHLSGRQDIPAKQLTFTR